jgi:Aspartyl/Asparaginyl beta-hydroxylase
MVRPAQLLLRRDFVDVDGLVREICGLEDVERASPGNFDANGWDGISLVMADGRADARSPLPSRRGPLPTPALARCPLFTKLLTDLFGELPGPILAARLLYLSPGGSAAQHRDAIGFPFGGVRLHLPIITHPDVELWLGGERTSWKPGELWYGDFAFPHRLANPTSITRVHLVIDVAITDALLALFAPELVVELLEGGVCRFAPPLRDRAVTEATLRRFEGHWHIPRRELFAIVLPEDLHFTRWDDEPISMVARGPGGDVALVLDPIGQRTLAIRGYYQGVSFEAADSGVDLVHRGRVGFDPDTFVEDETPWDLCTSKTRLQTASMQ